MLPAAERYSALVSQRRCTAQINQADQRSALRLASGDITTKMPADRARPLQRSFTLSLFHGGTKPDRGGGNSLQSDSSENGFLDSGHTCEEKRECAKNCSHWSRREPLTNQSARNACRFLCRRAMDKILRREQISCAQGEFAPNIGSQ
eukprot:scaffold170_cov281-Pinguiococcus_pyrenoidosus.AAC.11